MGAYITVEIEDKKEANKINDFIKKEGLDRVKYFGFNDFRDIEEAKKDGDEFWINRSKNFLGQLTIKVSGWDETEEGDFKKWCEDFTKNCEILNKHFKLIYYGCAFSEGEHYFNLDQMQRMTKNGKLYRDEDIYDEVVKYFLSKTKPKKSLSIGDEVFIIKDKSKFLSDDEIREIEDNQNILKIYEHSYKEGRYLACYLEKYEKYIAISDDVVAKVYPKDYDSSLYSADDRVLLKKEATKEKEIFIRNYTSASIFKIEFVCEGGYLIEIPLNNYKKKSVYHYISDSDIDCKVGGEVKESIDYKSDEVPTSTLVKELKKDGEDFEFYPTTNEIIDDLYSEIMNTDSSISFLDIGCGTGKVYKRINEISSNNDKGVNFRSLYAIEKSQRLRDGLDADVFVVGSDFWKQTLIDKKVDVIFSNPPYSEYEGWSEKIIREANAERIFLVIPKRWVKSQKILDALDHRGANIEVVGEYDFKDSEDRKARAVVNLLKIELKNRAKNPFDAWFNKEFEFKSVDEKILDESAWDRNERRREEIRGLVKGESLIPRLEELYNDEMNKLLENYKKLSTLDGELLGELEIKIDEIAKKLFLKISGLKSLYWSELFDNFEAITSRLTSKSRSSLLNTLTSNTSVDFCSENAYAIVIWAIRNCNKYYDEQLKDIYLSLFSEDNIKFYKSNKRMVNDNWRYLKGSEVGAYALDYRMVYYSYDALSGGGSLSRNASVFIDDILTIANNLGFNVVQGANDFYWVRGKPNKFMLADDSVFAEIKGFANGNLHFKFNKKFMAAFNLEASRLFGWIKNVKEFEEETDIKVDEKYFNSNFSLGVESLSNLLPYNSEITKPKNDEVEEIGGLFSAA
jgi:SAM-dependent methyltransferase